MILENEKEFSKKTNSKVKIKNYALLIVESRTTQTQNAFFFCSMKLSKRMTVLVQRMMNAHFTDVAVPTFRISSSEYAKRMLFSFLLFVQLRLRIKAPKTDVALLLFDVLFSYSSCKWSLASLEK